MPLIQAPPDALASIYARSLFELAEAQGGRDMLERIAGELEDILEMTRTDPKFNEFLASRILAVGDRTEALRRIFQGRIADLALNFLLLLNRKQRLGHLVPIVAAFDQMVQEKFGRVEVDLYTPAPITPEQLREIRDRLQATLKREPIIHPYTDPTLIGGIRLQIGDMLIDGSLASRLRRLKEQMTSQGAARIRARFDQAVEREPGDQA
jgi:F-type H+-transporting ATPase subunit delta